MSAAMRGVEFADLFFPYAEPMACSMSGIKRPPPQVERAQPIVKRSARYVTAMHCKEASSAPR